MLRRDADFGFEALVVLLKRFDQRRHLDGFGTSTENDEDFFMNEYFFVFEYNGSG